MAYCTQADITKAIPDADVIRLTDDTGAGTINATNVAEAIAKADAVINVYLRIGHTTPLATVPPEIRQISVDLTIYFLFKRRRIESDDPGLETIFKNNVNMLKEIRDGNLLIDDTTSFANTAGLWACNRTSDDKVFTDDVLDTF
jgi:phage gp36-like protein